MPQPSSRKKVDKSLRYRWGIVGIVLPVLIFGWYLYTNGRLGSGKNPQQAGWMQNFVKIVCPRCNKDPDLIKDCSLCNGLGFIWVDKTKDFPEEVVIP